MKRIVLISLMVLLFTNTVTAKERQTNELIEMASFVMENKLEVNSWEVTVKEHMNLSKLEEIVRDLRSSYSVTIEENKNSKIYLVRDTHKSGNINVEYSAVFPKNKQYQPEFIVSIQSDSWNQSIKSTYLETLHSLTSKFFTEDVKIFSCMSTKASAIIEKEIIVENFTEKLKIRHKNTQKDTINSTQNLEIIYGYTSLWGNKITIQDKPVNVQLVTKHIGSGDVQYIIGTPILINEY
jgi:TATA-box binding